MRRWWVLLGLLVVAVAVTAVVATRGPSLDPGGEQGVVVGVVDGDTVDVAGVGRVRVIGVDTPERGECGYEEASRAVADLVLGETVTLVPGARDDTDRYGRLLRYLQVGDTDVGLALLDSGLAVARYDSRDGYGEHPREDAYVRADARAAPVCDERGAS